MNTNKTANPVSKTKLPVGKFLLAATVALALGAGVFEAYKVHKEGKATPEVTAPAIVE